MSWQNPWAWLGLVFLVVPILVHLLARRVARVQPFPSLRFLTTARPVAPRRTRITDPLLLAVRLAIVACAVAALAQPYFLSDGRVSGAARSLTRAIVVDTSMSMLRAAPSRVPAFVVARREAITAAGEAAASMIIETAAPGDALAGAAAWLETRPGRRELVVLSDFQVGALDSVDLAAVPRHVGVQLWRSELAASVAVREHTVQLDDNGTVARVASAGDRTLFEWTRAAELPASDARTAAGGDGLVLLTAAAERAGADAVLRAARARGVPSVPASRPVALVFPGFQALDSVRAAAQPFDRSWMGDIAAALMRDPILVTAAADAAVTEPAEPPTWLVLARTNGGAPVVLAAAAGARLLLDVRTNAASSTSVALMAALGRAVSTTTPVEELEPRTVADTVLARWQRPAVTAASAGARGESDGRWLWLLCLALLGAETWMRRGKRPVATPTEMAEAS